MKGISLLAIELLLTSCDNGYIPTEKVNKEWLDKYLQQ